MFSPSKTGLTLNIPWYHTISWCRKSWPVSEFCTKKIVVLSTIYSVYCTALLILCNMYRAQTVSSVYAYTQAHLHVCVHSSTPACMCTLKHTCMYAYTQAHLHVRGHSSTPACMCTLKHTCMYAYTQAHLHVCVHSSTPACMRTLKHTCITHKLNQFHMYISSMYSCSCKIHTCSKTGTTSSFMTVPRLPKCIKPH